MRPLLDRIAWAGFAMCATVLVLVATGVVDAGSLDPPGPPGPTMRTLDEIEPRIPISSLPYPITQPGSYYLTGNLTGGAGNGITITSGHVTLDLNGFALQGVPGSNHGIRVDGTRRAIEIRNGSVRGWTGSGIDAQVAVGAVIDSIRAEGNGDWGIVLGSEGTLSNCSATYNGGSGISAVQSTITGCVSNWNAGGHGFQVTESVVKDCVASHNGFYGIDAAFSSVIENCLFYQNQQNGIRASSSRIENNQVYQNFGTGIVIVGGGSFLSRNNVRSNSLTGTGAGILVSGEDNRIEANHATDSGGGAPSQETGVEVTGNENVVVVNSAHGNGVNYALGGIGGTYGPLATAAAATNPFTNIDY